MIKRNFFSRFFLFIFLLLLFAVANASFDSQEDSKLLFLSPFIENLGQCDKSILFYSDNEWGRLNIREKDLVLQIKEGNGSDFKNIYLKFKSSEHYEILGLNKKETYFNYFIGEDKQIIGVPIYDSISIRNFFNGQDLNLGSGETNYFLKNNIEILNELFLIDSNCFCRFQDGHLLVGLKDKTVKIVLFEEENDVVPKNSESQNIIFSTYLGGTYSDGVFDIAFDSSGNIVVTGNTYSSNFPAPSGYDSTHNGNSDMFLAKISNNGSALVWGTFIGGSQSESSFAVDVDSQNNIVFGGLGQSDTPTPNGNSNSSNNQIYLGKLSSDGKNLIWGTKLGGGEASKITLDDNDFIYFVGTTSSNTLQCANGYDCSYNGGTTDLYVGKLNSAGSLISATYLGGTGDDGSANTYQYSSFIYSCGPFIDIDSNGNIVVATNTNSTGIPILGGYQTLNKGNGDIYIAKLSNDLSSLLASTFLGGSLSEIIGGLKIDPFNDIYIGGSTRSSDIPIKNAFQTSHSTGSYYDGYVAKLNSELSQLVFATFLGGSKEDLIRAIDLDGGGNALLTGTSFSSDFPLKNPYQGFSGYSYDAFLTALDKDGNELLESTFIRGNNSDRGNTLFYYPPDKVVVSGNTFSKDFPVLNSFGSTYIGEQDLFITKLTLSSISSCNLSCSANVPTTSKPNEEVTFASTVSVDPNGCTNYSVLWDFGDGTYSNEQNPKHKYSSEGKYNWTLRVTGNGSNNCEKKGTITITLSLCEIECSTTAPPWAMLNSPVTFTSTVSTDKCSDPLIYLWEFGDGTTSSQQNPSHTYTTKGTYTWKFSVSSGIISCEKSGTIYIDTERPCVQIGDLKFCADLVQQIDDKTSGLLGNVTLNDKLFFNGYVTVVKTSNTTGTLAINEGIYVKQIHGSDENVITGSAKFYVDGIDKALTQYEGPLMYSLNLLNLPLEIEGSEIKIEDDGIVVTPFLNLGVEPVILCRVQMSILLVPNDDKYILSVEVVNGQLTPSISVSSFSITYNPDDQEITGSASIGLPFLEIASLDASVQFKPGCLDGFSITIGLPTGIPLGTTGLEIDAFTLEIDNICTPARFYIFLGGDLAVAGVPSEVVVWEHLGLGYQVPFTLQIDGGSVAFLGYPLASTGGTITVYPPYASVYGQASIANVLVARISITLDISNLLISGNASGSFQIPNWDCCSVCLICKATRALVRNIFGTLPYVLAGVDMGVAVGQIEEGRWGGYLRGMLTFNNKSIAAEIKFDNGDISLLLGTNYDNLFEIWLAQEKALSPLGYEKSLNIAEDQERVVFSAAGVSALPEIYLVTPDGSRLTKENYTSYPGALYYESSEDNACFFEITSVSKGVWAFGMSNLNQGDGELFALCAHKKPEIEFESVSPSVKGYAVNLKVAPASADTKVSLFYTNSPDYANGLAIAKDLTSESGNYSISWDTSKVSNGSYLLFAKADDGKNPEEIAYYPNQITINKDGINPPTNLSGTRNGETANLTWTPSTSQNIAGYDILYTDEPEVYGYKYRAHSPYSDRGSVSGLALDKVYRFAVVAYDKDGKFSIESNSITLANTPPPLISSMTKLSSPFRINVTGSNLQQGIKVFINGTEWSVVTWKSTTNVKIKGGSSLKAIVPKGVDTTFKFVNPDGGETTIVWKY